MCVSIVAALVLASSIDLDEVNESTLPEVRSPTTLLKFDPSDVIRNIELAILSFASDSEVRRYFLDFTTFENRPFELEQETGLVKFTLWNIIMSTKKCFFKFNFFEKQYIAFVRSRLAVILKKVIGNSNINSVTPLVKKNLGGLQEKNETILVFASFISNINSLDLKVFSINLNQF